MPPLQDQTIIKEVKKIHKVLGFSIIKTYQCDAEEEALKVTQIFDEFKTECDNEQLIADKNIYSDNILRLTLMSFMRVSAAATCCASGVSGPGSASHSHNRVGVYLTSCNPFPVVLTDKNTKDKGRHSTAAAEQSAPHNHKE